MEFNKKDPKPLNNGIYKVDLFNRNPIFKVQKKGFKDINTLFVRSWEEAYALVVNDDVTPEQIRILCENQFDIRGASSPSTHNVSARSIILKNNQATLFLENVLISTLLNMKFHMPLIY